MFGVHFVVVTKKCDPSPIAIGVVAGMLRMNLMMCDPLWGRVVCAYISANEM